MGCADWGKLVAEGRAKAHGVPWSDAELKAVYELKIPADYVRNGCLTLEEYQTTQSVLPKDGNKANRYKPKEDLVKLAREKGIQFEADSVTRSDLILMLEQT